MAPPELLVSMHLEDRREAIDAARKLTEPLLGLGSVRGFRGSALVGIHVWPEVTIELGRAGGGLPPGCERFFRFQKGRLTDLFGRGSRLAPWTDEVDTLVLILVGDTWPEAIAGCPALRTLIEDADRRGVRVVPVFAGGRPLPVDAAVPEALRQLLRQRDAIVAGHDQNWVSAAVRLLAPGRSNEGGRDIGLAGLTGTDEQFALEERRDHAMLSGSSPRSRSGPMANQPPAPPDASPSGPVPRTPGPAIDALQRYTRLAAPSSLGQRLRSALSRWGAGGRQLVQCTVFARPRISRSEAALVQVFVHLPSKRAEAAERAGRYDSAAAERGFRNIEELVAVGETLVFHRSAPGLLVDEPIATLVWRKATEAVQFAVRVPPSFAGDGVLARLTIIRAQVPVGHIVFGLEIGQEAARESAPGGISAVRYQEAFIS
jgi:hypothetical protein